MVPFRPRPFRGSKRVLCGSIFYTRPLQNMDGLYKQSASFGKTPGNSRQSMTFTPYNEHRCREVLTMSGVETLVDKPPMPRGKWSPATLTPSAFPRTRQGPAKTFLAALGCHRHARHHNKATFPASLHFAVQKMPLGFIRTADCSARCVRDF